MKAYRINPNILFLFLSRVSRSSFRPTGVHLINEVLASTLFYAEIDRLPGDVGSIKKPHVIVVRDFPEGMDGFTGWDRTGFLRAALVSVGCWSGGIFHIC